MGGMVWVIAEAEKRGFSPSDPEWCNFGKGQPETEKMECGPERIHSVNVDSSDFGYGPVNGTLEMRQAVADHYNRLYRTGKKPYTAENVAIAQGGRLMLSRLFRVLQGRMGYQTPDYAGYQELFDSAHRDLEPVHIPTEEDTSFAVTPERFGEVAQDLDSFMCSNPCNPTGHVIEGSDLSSYCQTARSTDCLLVMDEFYSHFIYKDSENGVDCGGVSAAQHVVDPNTDPVLVIDGMTKSFRYPGWRLAWALGPPEIIKSIGCAGSALDGGPSTVSQRMALKALDADYMQLETRALRDTFIQKRNLMHSRLTSMGFRCMPCSATFYMWCCLDGLPAPLNTCMGFFNAALEKKIIVGPGKFFDINPGGKRTGVSAFNGWIRLSFGPCVENISAGLDRMEELLRDHGALCKLPLSVPKMVGKRLLPNVRSTVSLSSEVEADVEPDTEEETINDSNSDEDCLEIESNFY